MSCIAHEIDPRGDLRLRVIPNEGEPAVFVTSSLALARASPVFDRMLYGEFAEAKPAGPDAKDWTVELPDQKPETMHLFLNITHGHFQKVPKTVSIDELYDLTVLTNYLDSTKSLVPWIERWMALININDIKSEFMAQFLWIAWEFGARDDFVVIARRMLMELEGSALEESFCTLDQSRPPDIMGACPSYSSI